MKTISASAVHTKARCLDLEGGCWTRLAKIWHRCACMAHAPMLTCTHMQVLYGGYVQPRCHKQARRPCGQPGARRRDDDQLLQQLRCDQADQRTSTMLPRSPKQSKLHLPCKCYYDNNTTCRSTPTRRMTQAGVVDAPAPLYRPIDWRGHGSRRRQRHLHVDADVRSPSVGYGAHLYEGPIFVFSLNMNKVCSLLFIYFVILIH